MHGREAGDRLPSTGVKCEAGKLKRKDMIQEGARGGLQFKTRPAPSAQLCSTTAVCAPWTAQDRIRSGVNYAGRDTQYLRHEIGRRNRVL